MNISSIEFLGSFTEIQQCPKPNKPEYAFIGRSNVGKSSFINALTGRKSLARVSKSPGKTQTINVFEVDSKWRLVDLPGYGYAKVSQKQREKWDTMIINYLSFRTNLVTAFILVDARIPPQKVDLNFIDRLGKKNIPFTILFTKWDKVKKQNQHQTLLAYETELQKNWASLPQIFTTSSLNGDGVEEVLDYITQLNESLIE
ncbi:MAG TPA: ribosome biogenesis GTP-binding protein YihA/YsxC [Bacteroidales bacterium]|nr:ribosome biogenesis GTP-binding protein YihA/YsxC [Bacteroidales bacterium]